MGDYPLEETSVVRILLLRYLLKGWFNYAKGASPDHGEASRHVAAVWELRLLVGEFRSIVRMSDP